MFWINLFIAILILFKTTIRVYLLLFGNFLSNEEYTTNYYFIFLFFDILFELNLLKSQAFVVHTISFKIHASNWPYKFFFCAGDIPGSLILYNTKTSDLSYLEYSQQLKITILKSHNEYSTSNKNKLHGQIVCRKKRW